MSYVTKYSVIRMRNEVKRNASLRNQGGLRGNITFKRVIIRRVGPLSWLLAENGESMNTNDSFYNLAIHEAAHIVIAQLNNIDFEYIEILNEVDGHGATKFIAPGLRHLNAIHKKNYAFYKNLGEDEVSELNLLLVNLISVLSAGSIAEFVFNLKSEPHIEQDDADQLFNIQEFMLTYNILTRDNFQMFANNVVHEIEEHKAKILDLAKNIYSLKGNSRLMKKDLV